MNHRSAILFYTHHSPCLVINSNSLIILLLIGFLAAPSPARCDDADILLKFKESLDNAVALSGWNLSQPPCDGARRNWDGVMCEGDGRVHGLNLNGKGLGGTLDVAALAELTSLRVFGAMNNSFEGPLLDFRKLGSLKNLYLSHNRFSGRIPGGHFDGMNSLKKLHLAGNGFVGPIPRSLTTLGKLVELMIEDNKFAGRIPEFKQERFTLVNLSNNLLVGQIPLAFSNLNPSSFAGNIGLCGLPLKPCVDTPKLSTASKVIVGISLAATLAAIVVAVVILTTRKRLPVPEDGPSVAHLKTPPRDELERGGSEAELISPECPTPPPPDGKRPEQGMKLSFLVENRERFDLNELLKASAEMLGGGVFGSTYKAALGRGRTMAVKRFRHMNDVGREDFHEHMRRLGRLSHRNLLAVVAFHYRKEEKLLVSDFAPNLSLAFHLHGNSKGIPTGCGSRRRLDWATRLKVVKGVARGLSYLYAELPSLTAPHGHLKSTNVLLDAAFEPLLNDYGLLPVANAEHARKHVVAYKSPEYREGRRITRKTDVWALGMLVLEILTGRDGGELGAWVESSCAATASTGGGGGGEGVEVVFDEGLVGGGDGEWCGEMRKLLRIGMRCCEVDVEKRWDIKEAVKSIEELKGN